MGLPDILFIVLDTQRADRLGCYGYEKAITPNLDRFAAQSVLFEQAVAPAQWTIPSHASMFTGQYPTAHRVTQSSHSVGDNHLLLAEALRSAGYETVGFCNNPLVGILDNGLKRGFQRFYNYGGAIPSLPHTSSRLPWPLSRLTESYTQFLRRLSYPVQNFFGRSDLAFRLSLNAWTTPLWSKMANFKGQNPRSVQDVVRFLQLRDQQREERGPLFLFLNLMETHLPFWAPGHYVDQVAPYFKENREARTIMRTWNREAYRWAAPLGEPFAELEADVLSDMYDAEVAYQDDYLGELLERIEERASRRPTVTVIVADHGDGLGEHGYMGHAFVGYQELVHVPLIVRWPAGQSEGRRISTPVSTRRVFHTMLEAAGQEASGVNARALAEARRLSLRHTAAGRDPENGTAFSEIFPPLNFVRAIEQRQPQLLEPYRCLSERRTVVRTTNGKTFKLIQVDDEPDELFDLERDPRELVDVKPGNRPVVELLDASLNQMKEETRRRGDEIGAEMARDMQVDAELLQRLRGLGYVD